MKTSITARNGFCISQPMFIHISQPLGTQLGKFWLLLTVYISQHLGIQLGMFWLPLLRTSLNLNLQAHSQACFGCHLQHKISQPILGGMFSLPPCHTSHSLQVHTRHVLLHTSRNLQTHSQACFSCPLLHTSHSLQVHSQASSECCIPTWFVIYMLRCCYCSHIEELC